MTVKIDLSNQICNEPCKQSNCYCQSRKIKYSQEQLSSLKKLTNTKQEDEDLLHADSNDYRDRYDNIND